MRWLVVLSLLLATAASARNGTYPLAGLDDSQLGGSTEPFVRCSDLPDPTASTTALTTATSASDLHADIMAVCGSGCIVTLAPGTYDGNIVFGDNVLKSGSIEPSAEVLIRGTDPNNPPVIRATVDFPAAIIHVKNTEARIRVEDVILDGRRSEQTVAGVTTVCTDTTPDDDICDTGSNSDTFLEGFWSFHTAGGTGTSCLLRVQTRETVGAGVEIRDGSASTIEDSSASGAGCTTALCPLMSLPANNQTNAILKAAIGFLISNSDDSAVIDSTVSSVTKNGIECFDESRRCHIRGNTVMDAGIAGIVLNESDGTVVGNTITGSGLWYSPNLASDNTGQGIQFASGDAPTNLVATITGNTVSNVYGTGILIGLATATGYNQSRIDVSENSVSGACNGITASDSAGIILGDSTYDIAKITSADNSVSDSECVDGIRVRNVRTHRNWRNGTSGGLEVDDVDEFDGISLSITGNLDIDSDTVGRIRTCSLTGTVVGSANVQRQDCGEVSPPSGSSLWDTMVWGTDVWGS